MNNPLRGKDAPLGETPVKPFSKNDRSAETKQEGSTEAAEANHLPKTDGGNPVSSEKDGSSDNNNSRKRRRRRRRHKNPDAIQHKAVNSGPTDLSNKGDIGPVDYARDKQPTPKQGDANQQKHPLKTAKKKHNRQFNNRHRQQNNQKGQQLYAALDLGTNNCRLLVARPTKGGQFQVVDAFSRIVRLGEGLAANGHLSAQAMDRAIGALKVCASKLARHKIKKYRLIATEACRQASNGEDFLKRVKLETGLHLEMINRETEARLAVSGCASLVERDTKSVILFDIGGGSSEIAAIHFDQKRTARLANHIKSWTSLPVGVVTLSERFGGKNVTPELFENMVETVDQLLLDTAPDAMLAFEPGLEDFHLLGTSGTVTTLAGLHLELPKYDRRQVDGLWLENQDVDKMLDKLLSWDLKARSENPCIGPDRSDLVLAGCAIMQSIRKRWPSTRMRVADRGLREGLLNDMMARDGVWQCKRRNRNRRRNMKSGGTPQNNTNIGK